MRIKPDTEGLSALIPPKLTAMGLETCLMNRAASFRPIPLIPAAPICLTNLLKAPIFTAIIIIFRYQKFQFHFPFALRIKFWTDKEIIQKRLKMALSQQAKIVSYCVVST